MKRGWNKNGAQGSQGCLSMDLENTPEPRANFHGGAPQMGRRKLKLSMGPSRVEILAKLFSGIRALTVVKIIHRSH